MMLRQRDSHTKQMTEAPLSPRMAMRKQLREDPSGYLQSGVDEEPPALELFPKPMRPSSSTLFAKLNVEIIQYQRLVHELEALVDKSGRTPEDQWRSRILLRSIEEADQYIWTQIQQQCHQQSADRTVRASFGKVHRDYKRVNSTFRKILMNYKARQGVELSFLTAQRERPKSLKEQQAVEDDFFERTMKEREQEINRINAAMQQVNDIYKDLAHLVVSQQDQIDQVEGNIQYSNAATLVGTEHLKQVNTRTSPFDCGGSDVVVNGDDDGQETKTREKRRRDNISVCGDLKYSDSDNIQEKGSDTESDVSVVLKGSCEGLVDENPEFIRQNKQKNSNKGKEKIFGKRKQRVRRDSQQSETEQGCSWMPTCDSMRSEIIGVQKDLIGFVMSDVLASSKCMQEVLTCGSPNDVAYDCDSR